MPSALFGAARRLLLPLSGGSFLEHLSVGEFLLTADVVRLLHRLVDQLRILVQALRQVKRAQVGYSLHFQGQRLIEQHLRRVLGRTTRVVGAARQARDVHLRRRVTTSRALVVHEREQGQLCVVGMVVVALQQLGQGGWRCCGGRDDFAWVLGGSSF